MVASLALTASIALVCGQMGGDLDKIKVVGEYLKQVCPALPPHHFYTAFCRLQPKVPFCVQPGRPRRPRGPSTGG